MDDFAAEVIASAEEAIASDSISPPRQDPRNETKEDGHDQAQSPPHKKRWGGLSALREKASIQDRLVDKYDLPFLLFFFATLFCERDSCRLLDSVRGDAPLVE